MCSSDQSLIALAFLCKGFDFCKHRSVFNFNNFRLALGMVLKFYSSITKGLKLKIKKSAGLILTFREVKGGKLVWGCPPPPE